MLRPEFRRLLADLSNGVIDGVIFYDLDRLVRQPRDLYARTATLNAARDLYRAGPAEYNGVADAWSAVNVN